MTETASRNATSHLHFSLGIVRRFDENWRTVDFIVENRRGLKDSLTGDALHTKSLEKALEACGDLDVYNQYRAQKSAAKRQVITDMFQRMYGDRSVNLVVADSLVAMQNPAVRAKFAANRGARAAYEADDNTVYVLADQIQNLGQLYTDLAHERSHVDIAEHILGKSGGVETDAERQKLAEGRERLFGGAAGAEANEEAVAERTSVNEILKAVRDSNRSLPGAVAAWVRGKISEDTGFALDSISDADVRTELKFLADRGYLGQSAEVKGGVAEETDAAALEETQTQSSVAAGEMAEAEARRKANERQAVADKARGRAARQEQGREVARILAEDGRSEAVPPIDAAQEERADRGADMEAAMDVAEEQMGRMREQAAGRREAEDAENARLFREEEERAERVKERRKDVQAALNDAGGEIADMAERRRVVRERAEGVAQKNRREAEERNAAARDAEEAAALAEEEKYRPAREAIARREQDEYDQRMLEREEARGNNRTTKQEKSNETGNGADEASAQPEQGGVAGRPAQGEAARQVEGAETRPEAANAQVVAPQTAPEDLSALSDEDLEKRISSLAESSSPEEFAEKAGALVEEQERRDMAKQEAKPAAKRKPTEKERVAANKAEAKRKQTEKERVAAKKAEVAAKKGAAKEKISPKPTGKTAEAAKSVSETPKTEASVTAPAESGNAAPGISAAEETPLDPEIAALPGGKFRYRGQTYRTRQAAEKALAHERTVFRQGDTATLREGGETLTGAVVRSPDGSLSLRVRESVPRSAANPDGVRVRTVPVKDKAKLVKLIDNGTRFKRGVPRDWGDKNKSVSVVGGGRSSWNYVVGKRTKDAKAELFALAEANLAKQPNHVIDEESGNHCLVLDGVKFRVTRGGLFHGADRRLRANGPAIAQIGDVLNASVEVPYADGDWRYRIAATDFGGKGYSLITARVVDGVDEVVDVQTLYSVNVKASSAARVATPTNATRSNTDSIANLADAWQRLFKPGLDAHSNMRFKSAVTPEEDAAYMDAVKRGDMETAQRMVRETAARSMPNTKVVDEDGLPKVVYHATPERFTRFDKDKIFSTNSATFMEGFYFADSKPKTPWNVMPVFLNATNPLVLDLDKAKFDTIGAQEIGDTLVRTGAYHPDLNDYLIENGIVKPNEKGNYDDSIREWYASLGTPDSMIVQNTQYDSHKDEYVVLDPAQIKSADPVTYDDAGNVIPLSQRFDPQNEDIRFKVGGVFTGSAADYANRSRQGGVDDGPSVKHIGTGEGSQVYGWGLYGSTERGVAEGHAKRDVQEKKHIRLNGKIIDWESADKMPEDQHLALKAVAYAEGKVSDAMLMLELDPLKYSKDKELVKRAIQWLERNGTNIERDKPYLYEQTFFTNRAEGDESHLLKWYEPVTREQMEWIESRLKAEGIGNVNIPFLKGELPNPDNPSGGPANAKIKNGRTVYDHLANKLGSPQAASEFLARAGIDGIKYPVDSYGKTVKDGDKAGWNYVAFRDDNIRVDHKWTDGQMRFKRNPAFEHSLNALQAIADGEDYGVLHNAKYGEVRYPKGRLGIINAKGQTEGGMGFIHIVSERMRKDGATLEEGIDTAIRVGQAVEAGEETAARKNTRHFDYDGARAIVALTDGGNPIITGYEIRADEPSVAYPSADGRQPLSPDRIKEVVAALRDRISNLRAGRQGGIRYKSAPRAAVDDPDVLFGARESRKAHGLDDLTAEESRHRDVAHAGGQDAGGRGFWYNSPYAL